MSGFLIPSRRGGARLFRALLKKELIENLNNFRFPLALVLCLVVIPLAFYVSQKNYSVRRQAYDGIISNYELSHHTVLDVMVSGASAYRPPAPLALFAVGIEPLLPTAVETQGYVNLESRVRAVNSRRLGSPFSLLFGGLDLAFIVSTVMAILVMIFSFNSVAGERERGTLAQIMSNSVPRPAILAAKIAAGWFLLSVSFLAGILVGLIITSVSGFSPLRVSGQIIPFSIGIGISLVFLLVTYCFGVMISSVSQSSISAMVTLLTFWVVLAMLIPKGSVAIARLICPAKSQQIVDLEKNQVRLQIDRELRAAIQRQTLTSPGIKDMSYEEYAKARPNTDPAVAAFEQVQKKIRDGFKQKLDIELEKIDSDYERQKSARAMLARNLSRISPVSCLVNIFTELAGTGLIEREQWKNTRSRLQQIVYREITSKVEVVEFQKNEPNVLAGVRENNLDRDAPAPSVPPLPTPLSTTVAAVWVDLVLLFIFGVLFFAGAYVAFLTYDVRYSGSN